MAALVIESLPDALHARLTQVAAAHRRSVPQEATHLLEKALADEPATSTTGNGSSYWATRKFVPEFEAALQAGAFSGGTDSTQLMSDERDAR